jgi:succinoglycan biosynthesis protein ExoM
MSIKVSIVIVTFYREEFLHRTLKSCLAQRHVDPAGVELIAVDGSPDASARDVVDALRDEAKRIGMTLRFVHEPQPGISPARNAGVRAASGELVAFIDDDEEADPDWLSRILACRERFRADVVVGPVYPMFETERASRDPFWHWYFTADPKLPSGAIAKRGGGTHNCLFVKRTCCADDEPFDPALGLTGGEDTRFFISVAQRGGRVVWCADALINEFIPAARSKWAYAARRRFRENQLLMQSFLWADPPNFLGIATWMGIGVLQIAAFAPLGLLAIPFDRATAKKCLTKAVGGFGKLMWFPGLTLIGYGDRGAAKAQTA